ncbi:aldehyde dehydrogenase family protein [Larkinella rosea]|uniref:Aldehyde dehydrogenase n=1 Tax=Larkinella rosea TaxID=2025312 RepID=A0A3P1C1G1_9BACT|nr:aldehyde dehydrogenase family protein [Larkinella rosea]RRB07059.1 aldehyde dehydrogenase family protein [Larkinella rosea]
MELPAFNTRTRLSIQELFDAQRQQAGFLAATTASERIAKLKRIQTYLLSNRTALANALFEDFRKPAPETELTELLAINNELNVAIRHLKQWVKPHPVPTPLGMLGTSSHVKYEPKGVTLIISPWNYPLYLCLKPLISAIAAGNTAIVKPSELAPAASAIIRKMIQELFSADEVAVLEGDKTLAQSLLELPFDHIFFTGSTEVGKAVMSAAARNLSSVTLELGGKSPCIIDETADIESAARRVAWGKWINNGQTCVAPDFILIQRSVKDRFVRAVREAVRAMYDAEGRGVQASDSYARIVNNRHFDRVKNLLDDAVGKGATVVMGGQTDSADRFIEPTLLENVTTKMALMQDEIFGPLLPVIPYDTREEVIRFLTGRTKPLALYIFSQRNSATQFWLNRTTAGNTVVNDTLIHFAHTELPVGGVNQSGIGKSNGFYGFMEFSNARGIVKRQFASLQFIYPPYSDRVKKLLKILMKYI